MAPIEATGQQTPSFTHCPSCGTPAELVPGAHCPACGVPAPGDTSPGDAQAGFDAPAPGAAQPDHAPATAPAAAASPPNEVAMWAHLSALIALIGIPSPIGPLVVWLTKRDSHPFVDAQGKEALNFNLSAFLYVVVLGVLGFIFSFVTFGLGLLLFIPLAITVAVAWLVIVIVAAVKASKGEAFRYPLTIRFVS